MSADTATVEPAAYQGSARARRGEALRAATTDRQGEEDDEREAAQQSAGVGARGVGGEQPDEQ
jgi:hypothetical protein